LIDSADNGKMLKDGINTVIVGKPNAGKSSLLNILVGEDKAIVTSVAGTTRDVLEESIKLHGIGLNIIDTAGIRDTDDEVEKIGVDKARKYAVNADLIIYVVDGSRSLDENDAEIIKLIADKKVIVLLNKTDLEQVVCEDDIVNLIGNGLDYKIIKTSTKENTGIDEFEKVIKDMFFGGEIAVNDEIYITNQRHKEALVEAYNSINLVLKSLEYGMPEDFYSIDLMSAYASLGRIIGEEVEDDLVNKIFSEFCMGK
jgi:tRNA modification GTPase